MELKSLPVKIRNGVTIQVPNSPNVLTSYVLLEQEAWFEDEVEFVRRYLQPGECAADIGANFGVYTTAMAERVGTQGTIFAFEPASETCTYLRATIALRQADTVHVVQAALSDHSGTAELVLGSFPELNALATAGNATSASESVRLLTLDEYLADWPEKKLGLIKLDAEGHEPQVVAGARQVIQRDDPLVMFEIKRQGTFDLTMLDELRPFGLRGYRLLPGLNVLVPFEPGDPLDGFQLNLFAVSARRAQELEQRGILVHEPTREPSPLSAARPANEDIIGDWHTQPADGHPYAAALAHYAHSCVASSPASQVAHLVKAAQLASEACRDNFTVARVLTFARLAGILGLRNQAEEAMARVAGELMNQELPAIREPFLRPDRAIVPWSSAAHDRRRLFNSALEAFERARHFSTFYHGASSLPLLDHLCRQPDCSPEMQRRRQLVRMRTGVQWAPEPHPLLARDTADNLNAWFWNTVR